MNTRTRSSPTAFSWSLCLVLGIVAGMALGGEFYCSSDSDWFYVPDHEEDARLPALVILSCVGGTRGDLDSNQVVADSLGWILAACRGSRNHRAWSENDKDVMTTVRELLEAYPVQSDRIYICGFSGMGVQALGELSFRPDVFQGAIAACAPYRELIGLGRERYAGHAAYLITRTKDWNRDGNYALRDLLRRHGLRVQLVETKGSHEPGGTDELLQGCIWLERVHQSRKVR